MRKKIALSIIVVLALVLFLSISCRQKEKKEEKKETDWKTLITSDVEKERTSSRQVVLKDLEETIQHLLSILNKPVEEGEPFYTSNTPRNISIYLLGKFRAKKAVPDLLDWLTPKPGQDQGRDELLMFSPAGYALFNIGLPSVSPLVELLKYQTDSSLIEECMKLIICIKGVPETELLLENKIKSETNPNKKENLKAILKKLQDPQFRERMETIYDKMRPSE
jgi:hypothetical protein